MVLCFDWYFINHTPCKNASAAKHVDVLLGLLRLLGANIRFELPVQQALHSSDKHASKTVRSGALTEEHDLVECEAVKSGSSFRHATSIFTEACFVCLPGLF
jgi:hypothetical protein